jgi:hypothetical protein
MDDSHLDSAERSLGNQSENGGRAEGRCFSDNLGRQMFAATRKK